MLTKRRQNATWPTLWSLLNGSLQKLQCQVTRDRSQDKQIVGSRPVAPPCGLLPSSVSKQPAEPSWSTQTQTDDRPATTSMARQQPAQTQVQPLFSGPSNNPLTVWWSVFAPVRRIFPSLQILPFSLLLPISSSEHLQKLHDICLTAHAFTERWSLHHPLVLQDGMTKGCHGVQNKVGHTSDEISVSSNIGEAPIWDFEENWAINWSSQSISSGSTVRAICSHGPPGLLP